MIITKDLLKFFKIALNIVRKKAIIEGVYISNSVMYAANLEGQVAYTLEQNDISEPIVIPTKAAEYISSFPFNSKLELLVNNSVLTVKSGRNRAKFSLFDVNTYPKKIEKEDFLLSINSEDFIDGIKCASVAGDGNSFDSRVKCVHISNKGYVATDGKKLAIVDMPVPNSSLENCEITFPISHIGYLSIFDCVNNIEVNFAHNKRAIVLTQDDFELSSMLIECSDIKPFVTIAESTKASNSCNSFIIEQDNLKTALSRIALLSLTTENKIMCIVNNSTLTLANTDTNTSCEQVIDIIDNTSNEEYKMCLNLKNLREIIGSVDSDNNIKVIYAGGVQPVLLENKNKLFLMTQFRY